MQRSILLFQYQISKEFDNGKTVTNKLKFIDSFRFMSASLASLVDYLSEIYKKQCKGCEEKKKVKSVCNFTGLKKNKFN